MKIETLVNRYPLLYHMAAPDSWPSIREHGLLSTDALLSLYEAPQDLRDRLMTTRRPETVTIKHPKYGTASVRDQKPMIESKLKASLQGGMSLIDWYVLLNQRVFFWLTEERLRRLISAKAYRDGEHDVLTVRSEPLIREHYEKIELAAMNTGNTLPFAHPRGRQTFKAISEHPYANRVMRGLEPVVELTVLGGVRNIRDYVVKVNRWKSGEPHSELKL